MFRNRADHGLEEVRVKRKYKNGFVLTIVGWLCLGNLFLCIGMASGALYTLLGSAFFLLINALCAYLCYRAWTDPRYRRLREKKTMRNHFHLLPAPKEPSNPP